MPILPNRDFLQKNKEKGYVSNSSDIITGTRNHTIIFVSEKSLKASNLEIVESTEWEMEIYSV